MTIGIGCKPLGTATAAVDRSPVSLSGDFRLGPFLADGKVTATPLNAAGRADLDPVVTVTTDDSGDFALIAPAGPIELKVHGDFFDLMLAKPSVGGLVLRGITMAPGNRVHVNVLTHMAAGRILKLMAGGATSAAAVSRAEAELRSELGIQVTGSDAKTAAEDLDLLGGLDSRTTYLATVTAVMEAACLPEAHGAPDRIAAQLQYLLDSAAADLTGDGELGKALKEKLRAAQASVDPALPAAGLAAWAAAHHTTAAWQDLGTLLDADFDGKPNAADEDDDGDKVADAIDCAPLDSTRSMLKNFSQACVAPFPPPAVVALSGDKQVTVSWDTVSGPVKYTLLWCLCDALSEGSAKAIEDARPGMAVTGLANGSGYRFAVRTAYGGASSAPSTAAAAVPMAIPAGLKAMAGTGKIRLEWEAAEGATAYSLYLRSGPTAGKGDQRIPNVTSPFTLDKVLDGTRYSFALAGTNGPSEGGLGTVLSAVPLAAPGHTQVSSLDRAVILAWDGVPGAGTYTVFYQEGDSVGPASKSRTGRNSPDTVPSLVNGKRYAFRVQALAAEGASDSGATMVSVPMAVPGGLTATAGTGEVTVGWKPADGAQGYVVYYRRGTGPETRTSALGPPARFEGLANGAPYRFRIGAVNASSESLRADSVFATPLAAPESLSLAIEDGGASLRWAPVPGATGYSVFYAAGTAVDTAADRSRTDTPSARIDGLKNDATYAFVVRAEATGAASTASRTLHAVPMPAPAGFTMSAKPDTLLLVWDLLPGASGYAVYCGTRGQVGKDSLRFGNAVAPFAVADRDDGIAYTCAVEASRNGFQGPLSSPRTATFHSSTLMVGQGPVSDSSASYLSLALGRGGKAFLGFVDVGKNGEAHDRLKVSAFDGKSWQLLPAPTPVTPYACCALRVGSDDTPYLAFGDLEQAGRAVVKSYAAGVWTVAGSGPASAAKAEFMALALDAGNAPWLAFNDSGSGNRASVRRLQASGWVREGAAGFTTNPVGALSLEIGADGIPLIGDAGLGQSHPDILSYKDPSWTERPDPGRLLEQAATGRLAVAAGPDGAILLFPDRAAGFRATAAKWSQDRWEPLGKAGFTEQAISTFSLAVDASGVPYLAFGDEAHGGRLSVMKYADGAWRNACKPAVSAGSVNSVCIAVGADGNVMVAYRDAGLGGKAYVLRLVP